eukprot:5473807-Pyramimonas_sp.AAC.2
MRMRCCHFGLKFDRSSRLPSGPYLQVATTYVRSPANPWKRTCRVAGEPAQRAEQEPSQAQESHAGAAHSVHTRVDKGVRSYVQPPKNGPDLDHVVRCATMSLDDNTIMQDIKVQDQPIGCNYNAPLPSGVTNIRTRLCWKPLAPVLLGNEGQRQCPRRVTTVDDDHLPPPS